MKIPILMDKIKKFLKIFFKKIIKINLPTSNWLFKEPEGSINFFLNQNKFNQLEVVMQDSKLLMRKIKNLILTTKLSNLIKNIQPNL